MADVVLIGIVVLAFFAVGFAVGARPGGDSSLSVWRLSIRPSPPGPARRQPVTGKRQRGTAP
jgi:hypothetical protein